jgi:predicted Zn-ribbon and HTH transcriptional regulator
MQHSCPECSSGNVDRVRVEQVVGRLRTLLGWRVYRCRDCGARFEDMSLGHTCPQCFSGSVSRVPKESFSDHIKAVFGWRVYCCRDCGVRFYDRPLAKAS